MFCFATKILLRFCCRGHECVIPSVIYRFQLFPLFVHLELSVPYEPYCMNPYFILMEDPILRATDKCKHRCQNAPKRSLDLETHYFDYNDLISRQNNTIAYQNVE